MLLLTPQSLQNNTGFVFSRKFGLFNMAMLWSYLESLEDIEEYDEIPLCDFLVLDQGKTILESQSLN